MAKTVVPLNVTKINAAKPQEKMYKLFDGGGLHLRVMPNGRKVWFLGWRRPDKARDGMTLGTYPALGLQEARAEREKAHTLLAVGKDPKVERDRSRLEAKTGTFKKVAELWYEKWKTGVSEGWGEKVWKGLENDVFPALGNKPVKQITTLMVVDALSPMEKRGALTSLARWREKVENIFAFAIANGLAENNPATATVKAFTAAKKTNFRALPPSGLTLLVDAIRTGGMRFPTRMVLLWQLLTLSRPNEAAKARWDEIDLEEKLWRVPAEKMKKRRPHDVHLSELSLKILGCMRPLCRGGEYIFPGYQVDTHISVQTAGGALRRLEIDTTAHGLRALADSTMSEEKDPVTGRLRFDAKVIEMALAHLEKNQTTAAYDRALYLEPRRDLLNWWCEKVKEVGGDFM